jgi:hypothetical protein
MALRPSITARLLAAAGTLCAAALLLSGCSPKEPDPTFVGSTKYMTAPPNTVTPSTVYQSNVPTASPELYQQAYDLYVQYFTDNTLVQQGGGAADLPAQMAPLLTGDALDKVTAIYQAQKQNGFYWVGVPAMWTVKVTQLFDNVPLNTTIALQSCEETSGGQLFKGDGTEIYDGHPSMVVYHYFMTYNDQHQRIINNIGGGTQEVETCPF